MKQLLFLTAFAITGFCATSQITSAEIDSLMTKALTEFKVVGAAIAVVKDGKIIHEKGYGLRSIESKLPVNEHTNFQIASNSKAFTTAALSILVDEKKLSWDDRVRKYIPEFTMYNEYVAENFTIEDLLCHRSGLGLGAGDLMFFPDGSDFTIKDVLANFKHLKQTSQFRTKWDYDNLLYLVAGEVIHRVSGSTWEDFVQTRIMAPLQMERSAPAVSYVKDWSNVAMPHSTVFGPVKQMKPFVEAVNGAAGAILSNVNDMSNWMITQLSKGKYGDKQLFTAARQRGMWAMHTNMNGSGGRYNMHFTGYGLGWFLNDLKGNLNASHSGGLPGMISYVSLLPDMKTGYVILTNTESGGGALYSAINLSLLDAYLGVPKRDWIKIYKDNMAAGANEADSVLKKVWSTVATNKGMKIDAKNYIGTYEDPWFGKAEVFMKGDQLWIKCLRSPKLNGPMYFYQANTFAVKWEYQDMQCDAFAMFRLDEEGKATGLKMKGISPEIDFSFDFQDLDFKRTGK